MNCVSFDLMMLGKNSLGVHFKMSQINVNHTLQTLVVFWHAIHQKENEYNMNTHTYKTIIDRMKNEKEHCRKRVHAYNIRRGRTGFFLWR